MEPDGEAFIGRQAVILESIPTRSLFGFSHALCENILFTFFILGKPEETRGSTGLRALSYCVLWPSTFGLSEAGSKLLPRNDPVYTFRLNETHLM